MYEVIVYQTDGVIATPFRHAREAVTRGFVHGITSHEGCWEVVKKIEIRKDGRVWAGFEKP